MHELRVLAHGHDEALELHHLGRQVDGRAVVHVVGVAGELLADLQRFQHPGQAAGLEGVRRLRLREILLVCDDYPRVVECRVQLVEPGHVAAQRLGFD